MYLGMDFFVFISLEIAHFLESVGLSFAKFEKFPAIISLTISAHPLSPFLPHQ